jgi:hypothetical protein
MRGEGSRPAKGKFSFMKHLPAAERFRLAGFLFLELARTAETKGTPLGGNNVSAGFEM